MSEAVAPDGCPVQAYASLPAEPELSVVRSHVRGRTSVLDLGCGTGRIADPLALDGHDVVAVDESAEMLQQVQHARPVHETIARLDLGRSFDAVLMLSHLVNDAAAETLLAVAARHLADDGVLVAQRLEPDKVWRAGSARFGPVTVGVDDVVVVGDRVRATTTYTVDGRSWLQPWEQWMRNDEQLTALLAGAGLRPVELARAWVTATR